MPVDGSVLPPLDENAMLSSDGRAVVTTVDEMMTLPDDESRVSLLVKGTRVPLMDGTVVFPPPVSVGRGDIVEISMGVEITMGSDGSLV